MSSIQLAPAHLAPGHNADLGRRGDPGAAWRRALPGRPELRLDGKALEARPQLSFGRRGRERGKERGVTRKRNPTFVTVFVCSGTLKKKAGSEGVGH